jgi:hypothetical protein
MDKDTHENGNMLARGRVADMAGQHTESNDNGCRKLDE